MFWFLIICLPVILSITFSLEAFPVLILIQFLAYADPLNLPSAERFNYLLDVLSNGSASDDGKPRHTDTHTDQERYELR